MKKDYRQTGKFPILRYALKYDIWEYIPMDQGGRLVHLQLIGSEKDQDIVAAVRRQSFFSPWGNPIRWDSLEATQIEKSVWLNRWYYLPSFARCYFLSGERRFLDDLLKLVRAWKKGNPIPADIHQYFKTGKYIWRDMQVAWRTQNLIWCYFLGEKGFSAAEKTELVEIISEHAKVLYEYFGKQPLHENNHQSHGAAAMLYAGILFPHLPRADRLRKRAIDIFEHHLKFAFHADGNSVELSPGYYPFIASIFRDAYLLCDANEIRPPKQSRLRLIQFQNYLQAVSQPDGTMPPVNDSSESSGVVSLRVLREVLGVKARPVSSHLFKDSHQAVMRDANTYLFVDAGPQMLWHWHGGKLGFHLWHGNRPILVDSGVCNYDEARRIDWYCTPEAHNTLIVDGSGDYAHETLTFSPDSFAHCKISGWESNKRFDLATMVHRGFANRKYSVRWVRHIVLIKNGLLVIIDQITSNGVHEYRWPFHFSPGTLKVNRKRLTVATKFESGNVILMPGDAAMFDSLTMTRGWVNRRSKSLAAPVANFKARAKSICAAFLVVPIQDHSFANMRMSQTVSAGAICMSGGIGKMSFKIRAEKDGEVKITVSDR